MRRPFSLILSTLAVCILFSACSSKSEARMPGMVKSSLQSNTSSSVRSSKSSVSVAPAIQSSLTPPKNWSIPILVYHHVRKQQGWSKSTWSWKMTVTPETFEKQMQWLSDDNYTTIDLNTFVSIIKGERAGPTKPIVITFDDNQESQYTEALPVLQKHHQIAVFYLITGRINAATLLSTAQIKEMSADGMDIESHTITHRVLTLLSLSELDKELTQSKKTLETLLGKTILHIAYPGTAHNKTVREHAAAAGYITGTIMDPRNATEKDDLMKLPRIMMTDDTNLTKVLP